MYTHINIYGGGEEKEREIKTEGERVLGFLIGGWGNHTHDEHYYPNQLF